MNEAPDVTSNDPVAMILTAAATRIAGCTERERSIEADLDRAERRVATLREQLRVARQDASRWHDAARAIGTAMLAQLPGFRIFLSGPTGLGPTVGVWFEPSDLPDPLPASLFHRAAILNFRPGREPGEVLRFVDDKFGAATPTLPGLPESRYRRGTVGYASGLQLNDVPVPSLEQLVARVRAELEYNAKQAAARAAQESTADV